MHSSVFIVLVCYSRAFVSSRVMLAKSFEVRISTASARVSIRRRKETRADMRASRCIYIYIYTFVEVLLPGGWKPPPPPLWNPGKFSLSVLCVARFCELFSLPLFGRDREKDLRESLRLLWEDHFLPASVRVSARTVCFPCAAEVRGRYTIRLHWKLPWRFWEIKTRMFAFYGIRRLQSIVIIFRL